MKVALVIPARLGATRLPEKPLRDLGGKPLIVRVWERVSKMGVGDRVVVATDHPRIEKVIRDLGGDVIMTSPECNSGTARVAEVAAHPEFADFEAFVNVQGDEPFIGENCVRMAAEMVTSGKFTLGTSAVKTSADILKKPDIVKVIIGTQGQALYFSRAGIPHLRDEGDSAERDSMVLQHIGVYSYTRDALQKWLSLPVHPLEIVERLEQLRPLANGIAMGVAVVDDMAEAGIDTEEDLERANARFGVASQV